MYIVTWECVDTLTIGIYAVVHPRTVKDIQCNLGIRGYSDSRYICSCPSLDSPGMYNMTLYNFASVITLAFYDFPWCHWTVMD